jgi:Tfp pilus assembly protein PilO
MAQLATSRNISNILQTSQQKALSTGLLTFALVVALLWGSFRPTVITIIQTNRKFAEKEAALTKLEKQNTNLTNLLKDRLEQKDKLQALDYYFPSDGDYSLFVTNLNQIAKRYKLSMDSVSFSASYFRQVEKITALQFPEMTPQTFLVTLTGDASKLSAFLTYVESMPFLPKVLSVGYSPHKTDATKTTMSITLLLYKMSGSASPHE